MIEFLKTEKLIYLPIYYYIDDNSKKKIPVYEKNNATIEEINALKDKKNMYPKHKNKKKINGIWSDETPLSKDECAFDCQAINFCASENGLLTADEMLALVICKRIALNQNRAWSVKCSSKNASDVCTMHQTEL